ILRQGRARNEHQPESQGNCEGNHAMLHADLLCDAKPGQGSDGAPFLALDHNSLTRPTNARSLTNWSLSAPRHEFVHFPHEPNPYCPRNPKVNTRASSLLIEFIPHLLHEKPPAPFSAHDRSSALLRHLFRSPKRRHTQESRHRLRPQRRSDRRRSSSRLSNSAPARPSRSPAGPTDSCLTKTSEFFSRRNSRPSARPCACSARAIRWTTSKSA